MTKHISMIALPLVLILAAFFTYGGCHNSNGNNMGGNDSDTANVFTPVVSTVLAPPVPVLGSDGKYHITYELFLTNSNVFEWEILSIEVFNGSPQGEILDVVSGDGVLDKMQLVGTRQPTTSLQATQSGLVFMTFTVDNIEEIPDKLVHKITITVPGGLPEFIKMLLELPEDQEDLSAFGQPVAINNMDIFVFGPPLEGSGWVAINGCCDSFVHVRSDLSLNGKIFVAQRYAIDWLKVDDQNRLYVGDPQVLDSWIGYNENVLAVSDAQVIRAVDKFPDQTPFILPADQQSITLEEIDGNHVILALPNGQFAFYAHLKPGSIAVQEGDFVLKGQVIAKLGNTGNSGAPHMHLHIMETASSLGSDGLPHVFDQYTLIGRTTEESFFEDGLEDNTPFVDEETGLIIGNSIEILPVPFPGIHNNDLPLSLRVVEFP